VRHIIEGDGFLDARSIADIVLRKGKNWRGRYAWS